MQNIQEMRLKIKRVAEGMIGEWGLIAIVLSLGVASFGLGRLSALEEVKPPVAIKMAQATSTPRAMYRGGLLVGSRNGRSYYYPWCSGVAKISQGNQVWFKSEESARAAGYAPAKNCKGLETVSR